MNILTMSACHSTTHKQSIWIIHLSVNISWLFLHPSKATKNPYTAHLSVLSFLFDWLQGIWHQVVRVGYRRGQAAAEGHDNVHIDFPALAQAVRRYVESVHLLVWNVWRANWVLLKCVYVSKNNLLESKWACLLDTTVAWQQCTLVPPCGLAARWQHEVAQRKRIMGISSDPKGIFWAQLSAGDAHELRPHLLKISQWARRNLSNYQNLS